MYDDGLVEKAWSGVFADYQRGLVVSESTLMACFYHHARRSFEVFPDIEIYTEPSLLYFTDGDTHLGMRMKPDVVIVRRSPSEYTLLAIIELKFKPYWRPSLDEDISKFELLASCKSAFCHGIEVASGMDSDVMFKMGDETQFLFGVVGNTDKNAAAVDSRVVRERTRQCSFRRRFTHMAIAVSMSGNKLLFDPHIRELEPD